MTRLTWFHRLGRMAATAVAITLSSAAWSQAEPASAYPSRPLKLVVPFSPGGPNDLAARLVAPYLSKQLKQPVVIHNLPGAGGRIGSKSAATAAPDGYTLMMGGTNLNVVIPAVYKGLDYSPVDDFVPVGAVATDAMLLAINPRLPVRTVREFLDYAKRNPGKLSAGSAPGIGPHFVIEMFKLRTGADLTFVPYKGAAPAIQDAMGGHIAMTVTNKGVLLPLIQKGRLRALAVTSPKRLPDLPDVPTLLESGISGVPSLNWYGVMAPAKTPPAIVAKVAAALADLAESKEAQDGIRRLGLEPRLGDVDFAAQLAAQRTEWKTIVEATRITLD
jgi:tripartite-type tricarboxylate transporter receptor subunit TctC